MSSATGKFRAGLIQIGRHASPNPTRVVAREHLVQEVVGAHRNVAQSVLQPAPEMRGKAGILYLAKEFGVERPVECPPVDQEREQQPPSPHVPFALEELALLVQ